MKVPQWLLRILLSYLQKRKMILRFQKCCSHQKCLSGGCPQGTLIGVILYILYINPIGYPGEITLQISDFINNYSENIDILPDLTLNNIPLPKTLNSAKFMDDATIQESIDLTTALASRLDRSGPLPWWEASGKLLPPQNSLLQSQIETLKKISDNREMVLNPDKTKLMIINFTHNHQFQSLLSIPDSTSSTIKLCFKTKILGFWLTHDMKTATHVKYITTTAYKRLWAISRLKSSGVSNEDIFHFYIMKIRSVLEYAAPVFTSMLTEADKSDIERIQKTVLKILLGPDYIDYEQACTLMKTSSLQVRREHLSLRFALSCLKSPKHKHLFTPRTSTFYNLRNIKSFEIPHTISDRYYSSPIPYLTRLLNDHFSQKTGVLNNHSAISKQ